MRFRLLLGLCAAIANAASGCTTFATARSAVVPAGPSLVLQGAVASPPGDVAGWLWSYDCASDCNHAVPGGDAAFAYGRADGAVPFTLGGGVNGLSPYFEGYVQLRRSARLPAGAGARVGLPVYGWASHQLYARVDVPLGNETSLLWNPGVVYHGGHSPNGENSGSFLGIVQTVGLQAGRGPVSFIPSAGVVWGRAERESYGERVEPESNVFAFGAVALQFSRRR